MDRIFQIAPNVTVTLENLEITGGLGETDSAGGTTESDGGAIVDLGALTLNNVAVVDNKAISAIPANNANGGGIYVSSNALGGFTVNTGSSFVGNSALTASGLASGGGMYVTGSLSISASGTTFSNNAAIGGAGQSGLAGAAGRWWCGGLFAGFVGRRPDEPRHPLQ